MARKEHELKSESPTNYVVAFWLLKTHTDIENAYLYSERI